MLFMAGVWIHQNYPVASQQCQDRSIWAPRTFCQVEFDWSPKQSSPCPGVPDRQMAILDGLQYAYLTVHSCRRAFPERPQLHSVKAYQLTIVYGRMESGTRSRVPVRRSQVRR